MCYFLSLCFPLKMLSILNYEGYAHKNLQFSWYGYKLQLTKGLNCVVITLIFTSFVTQNAIWSRLRSGTSVIIYRPGVAAKVMLLTQFHLITTCWQGCRPFNAIKVFRYDRSLHVYWVKRGRKDLLFEWLGFCQGLKIHL